MAFDACMMRAVLSEYTQAFPEAKIEKVLQPQNDEIDLVVHYGKCSRRLIFNVGANAPRLQLSDAVKENPVQAPMFCMFLRKKLIGGRITSVAQPGMDRVAVFTVRAYDEMGFLSELHIICEIMGKYANLILTDREDRILSALKLIDFASSSVRQILPGLHYTLPAMPERCSPLELDRAHLDAQLAMTPQERSCEKFITATYAGVATQIAHELTYQATGAVDTPLCAVDPDRLYRVLAAWQQRLLTHDYEPCVALNAAGETVDYSYMPITYRADAVATRRYGSFAELFDQYFAEKDRRERIHQRAHDLERLLANAASRTERKLELQREALRESETGDRYRRMGDLITANLYALRRGQTSFQAVDYYDESCPTVQIALEPTLSPAANAQRMYKLYNKCKKAREVLTPQIARWERELVYIDSVRTFLANATCEQDLIDLRDELYRTGYSARMKGYSPQRKRRSRPLTAETSGGFLLYIGRSNVENDELTFHVAHKEDIWFHVKDMPGSHVILVTEGREPSERDYTEAASLAAGYSKSTGSLVPVDYTRVKHIRKVPGEHPGFVTYKTNYTAYVHPCKRLTGTAEE